MHCAEVPKKPEPRRATLRELAKCFHRLAMDSRRNRRVDFNRRSGRDNRRSGRDNRRYHLNIHEVNNE